MGSLDSKILKMEKKVKDIYDQGFFGESSERVTITWGKNKIGFDKPVGVSIEDAMEQIVVVFRADPPSALKEENNLLELLDHRVGYRMKK